MGGSTAEVSASTTEILLESAYFERMGIARSSKRLKLRSESSARFERGIDPEAIAVNAARAMELLVEVAGARVAPDAADVYPAPVERERIRLRASRVNVVLGTRLDAEDVWASLAPLGIELAAGDGADDAVTAIVPTFRPDLDREIDLVEEVARRIGFDHIGRTLPDTHGQVGALTERQRERRLVADALVGVGLSEAITLSLVAPSDLERAGAPLEARRARRRIRFGPRSRCCAPRCSRGCCARSRATGRTASATSPCSRWGACSSRPSTLRSPTVRCPTSPSTSRSAWAGSIRRRPLEDDRPVDVYDALDAVTVVLDALGIADVTLEPVARTGFRPGRAAELVIDGRAAGTVGEIASGVLDAFGLDAPVVAAELVLDALLDVPRRDRAFRAPSRFPASTIDLAFVVADAVAAADVVRTLRATVGELLEEVRTFDAFRSDAMGDGLRSLAFSLRFRAPDRTLTDADVGVLRQSAIVAVRDAHRGELRG